MACSPKGWLVAAAVSVACLLPRAAPAQEVRPSLKLPTTVASIAAAADWASTYYVMTNYHVRETNVLLQPWQKSPGQVVAVGAAIDAASFTAWNMWMGPRHPKIAAAGMWAMAGFRSYLVFHNLRNTRKAIPR